MSLSSGTALCCAPLVYYSKLRGCNLENCSPFWLCCCKIGCCQSMLPSLDVNCRRSKRHSASAVQTYQQFLMIRGTRSYLIHPQCQLLYFLFTYFTYFTRLPTMKYKEEIQKNEWTNEQISCRGTEEDEIQLQEWATAMSVSRQRLPISNLDN